MVSRKALKLSRIGAGYTQLNLADEVGIKERDITLIETGRKESSPAVAQRIAKVLDTKKEKLFPELFLNETEEVEK